MSRYSKENVKSWTPPTVQQNQKAETDINTIVSRYHQTGVIPPPLRPGHFGDFTEVGDYLDCCLRVNDAQARFMELPPQVRAHCQNDPAVLLAMSEDPEQLRMLSELGLNIEGYEDEQLEPLTQKEKAQNEHLAREIGALIRNTREGTQIDGEGEGEEEEGAEDGADDQSDQPT